MIKRKEADSQLFYAAEELYVPPPTNFYARLDTVVGSWEDLAAPLRSCFCEDRNGRPVDPVVYFKIHLVGYLEGIKEDTTLAERIADSLSIRHFLGYSPSEKTPDHCAVSRTRHLFGERGKLDDVFDQVVELCVRLGLVGGKVAAVDSTLIKANASLSSLSHVQTGEPVSQHLARARAAGEKLQVSNEKFHSATDPDARIAKKTSAPKNMYYKATHVTDSKRQIILAARVDTADTSDPESGYEAACSAKKSLKRCRRRLKNLAADTGYDDATFHARIEGLGIQPITNYSTARSYKPEGLGKESFSYDPERDLYLCPNGATLRGAGLSSGRRQYRARRADCRDCPLRSKCLEGSSGFRTISRDVDEEARERNIARCHSPEGRKFLKLRKTIVEPPFGHAKMFGGLSKINCRGKAAANAKILFGAMAWNLKKRRKIAPFWALGRSRFYPFAWSHRLKHG